MWLLVWFCCFDVVVCSHVNVVCVVVVVVVLLLLLLLLFVLFLFCSETTCFVVLFCLLQIRC